VKHVGLKGMTAVPAVESVEGIVALILTIIPVGLKAVSEALETDVMALLNLYRPRLQRIIGYRLLPLLRGALSRGRSRR